MKKYCVVYNYKTKQFEIQSSNAIKQPLQYFRIQDFLNLKEAKQVLKKPKFNLKTKDFQDFEWLNDSIYFSFVNSKVYKYNSVLHNIERYIKVLNLLYSISDSNELEIDSIQELLNLNVITDCVYNIQDDKELEYLVSENCSIRDLKLIQQRIKFVWSEVKKLSNIFETKCYQIA